MIIIEMIHSSQFDSRMENFFFSLKCKTSFISTNFHYYSGVYVYYYFHWHLPFKMWNHTKKRAENCSNAVWNCQNLGKELRTFAQTSVSYLLPSPWLLWAINMRKEILIGGTGKLCTQEENFMWMKNKLRKIIIVLCTSVSCSRSDASLSSPLGSPVR